MNKKGNNFIFSIELADAFEKTKFFALEKRYEFVTIDNFMIFISETEDGKRFFESMGVDVDSFKSQVEEYLKENIPNLNYGEAPQITVPLRDLLKEATIMKYEANLNNQNTNMANMIGINEILVALFVTNDNDLFTINYFKNNHVTDKDAIDFLVHGKPKKDVEHKPDYGKRFLNKFAVLLNTKAQENKIDPIIGRDEEIEKVVTILAQRKKNNPILVGDPGVGKTAIAEGLAKRIVEGQIPHQLSSYMIYSLDLPSIVAGTRYRGDFEERFKNIIKEAAADSNVVLFIDEIHTLIGTGSGMGTMDASNILKPFLSNGELKVIGATTYEEYKKIFEKEGALTRRFQKVSINEPSIENSIQILMGLKSKYEEFHNVSYKKEAIESAVKMTVKYMIDKKLPDKAIDVIDMAGADFKLHKGTGKYITTKEIAKVVAKIVNIPVSVIEESEKEKLKNLEKELKKEIFGQDDAITQAVDHILLSRSNLVMKDKPIANFVFAGPSGVGKTELSKQIALKLGLPIVRFDMSEYMEKHTVARLIGAPPGYVGHEQGGQLIDQIRKTPSCVLLLDEIEKANTDIYNILLQIMDYGILTDSNGKKADFKNVILIMTSNLGSKEMHRNTLGFTQNKHIEHDRNNLIKKAFSPEFYNRLDSVIHFNSLSKEYLTHIVKKHLGKLQKNLQEKKIKISFSKETIDFIEKNGFDEKLGARPIERYIENEISKPLAKQILFGDFENGGEITLHIINDKIHFTILNDYKNILENVEIVKEKPMSRIKKKVV